ncbi:accessory Sec system translocase SecA2 [Limosilactobacillus sp.]|uniref:accessory Sec system translocase SecA2 n=1 Tax=Limosilactobacillus sp. TaxID=2773925 RepID=UPI00345EADA7
MLMDQLTMHRVRQTLKKVNRLAPTMKKMSDEELKGQTDILKRQLKDGKTEDDILPQAYAVVREADRRVLGMYPYDVQVMGAIVLNSGNIAEMKTGEGKTLTATMPLYLNALSGKGAMLVTPNAYLAERDETQLAPVYNWLGLTAETAFPKKDEKDKIKMDAAEKRRRYAADIVYITSSGLAFDYLFNNLADNREDQYLRPYNYALVDEVDAVLLDNATSPFVVSSSPKLQSNLYELTDNFVTTLRPKVDYVIRRRDHATWLTSQGIEKAELYFRIDDLFALKYRELYRHIILAMRAHFFMERDHDYAVRDGKVVLLDETNGRLMKGIQISTGIHQAIEQKEHVEVTAQQKTAASITFPSLFGLFNKVSGMSGTAKVNENEFINVYNMKVVQIPTNKPMIRKDLPDKIYLNTSDKLLAAMNETVELHKQGRPVLLVAGSVDNSEIISELLLNRGIAHNVLNAYNASREAAMVKDAGHTGAVTVATNMAGRGTDIKLSDHVKKLGGLAVIGTEMLPERVRLQLAGRAGRQGDPGTSQFYISLEDSFISKASTDRFRAYYRHLMAQKRRGKNIVTLHGPRIQIALDMLKNRVASNEENNRTQTNRADVVLRMQRNNFYRQRNHIIDAKKLDNLTMSWLNDGIDDYLDTVSNFQIPQMQELVNEHFDYGNIVVHLNFDDKASAKKFLVELAHQILDKKEKQLINDRQLQQFYRSSLLQALDECWTDEVDYLNKLQAYTSNWAMASRDSGYVYNQWALEAYKRMFRRIKKQLVDNLLLSEIQINKKNELILTFN